MVSHCECFLFIYVKIPYSEHFIDYHITVITLAAHVVEFDSRHHVTHYHGFAMAILLEISPSYLLNVPTSVSPHFPQSCGARDTRLVAVGPEYVTRLSDHFFAMTWFLVAAYENKEKRR